MHANFGSLEQAIGLFANPKQTYGWYAAVDSVDRDILEQPRGLDG